MDSVHREPEPTAGPTVLTCLLPTDSTTVFVGQCFVDKSREESLHTMWLLREEVKAEKDDWKATRLHLRLYWECRPPPTPSHQPGLCTGSTSGCQLRIQHGEQQCYLALWAWAVHLSKL
ncbi:avidin-like [Alligator mississippiensis]|uniref:avidin-like n=1 Tax=Alligator mississippiensis TaxID=8496 RepID=UPI0028774407|nr:avidin-like [Alligator mississippiensis]